MRKYLACLSIIFIGNVFAANLMVVAQSAINNNFSYQASKEQMFADQAKAREALALWLPLIGAEGGLMRGNYQTDVSAGQREDLNLQSSDGVKNDYWSVGVRQQIINFSDFAKLREADIEKTAISLNYSIAQQKLLKEVIHSYFDVLVARELSSVAASDLVAARKELIDARNMRRHGVIVKAQVEEAVADKQNALLKRIQVSNDASIALERLNAVANGQYNHLAQLKSNFIDAMPKVPPCEYWKAQVLRYNPALQLLQLQIDADRKNMQAAELRRLPTVAAYANYTGGVDQNGGAISSAFGSPNVSVGANVPANGGEYSYHGGQIGIEAEMPIYTGGYISDEQAKRLHILNHAQLQLDNQRQEILLAVEQAYQKLIVARQGIVLAQAEINAAHSGLVNMGNEVNEGFRSVTDLSDARAKYVSAQENLIQTKYEYISDLVDLKYLVGDLNQQTVAALNGWLIS